MSSGWGKCKIHCPECAGECLTDGRTMSCIECPFETTTEDPEGKSLLRAYYRTNQRRRAALRLGWL